MCLWVFFAASGMLRILNRMIAVFTASLFPVEGASQAVLAAQGARRPFAFMASLSR
jgi:hypothetical protein